MSSDIRHQLLVALPGMTDPRFYHSVVYLCDYSEQGAMGLIVNKPMQLSIADVLHHLEIDVEEPRLDDQPVLMGGPVAEEQGFIVHFDTLATSEEQIVISSAKQDLINIAEGKGPKNMLICLGYCGWGQGQLEMELKGNSWLIAPADPELLFNTEFDKRWQAAANLIGVDLSRLAGDVGHA